MATAALRRNDTGQLPPPRFAAALECGSSHDDAVAACLSLFQVYMIHACPPHSNVNERRQRLFAFPSCWSLSHTEAASSGGLASEFGCYSTFTAGDTPSGMPRSGWATELAVQHAPSDHVAD